MAKQRYVNTKFWRDNYVSNLDPSEKLLFLYLLTNPDTNIAGKYEIPIKQIALDTGLDKDMVDKIIKRFSKDKKVFYIKGWILIVNFEKHQSVNPKIEKGIQICINDVPDVILAKYNKLLKPIDRLSKPLNYSNTNTNTNTNIVLQSSDCDINPLIELFKDINPTINFGNKTQRNALKDLVKKFGYEKTENTIKYAVSIQGSQYAPTITTPYQLKNKIGDLMVFYKKENNNKPLII